MVDAPEGRSQRAPRVNSALPEAQTDAAGGLGRSADRNLIQAGSASTAVGRLGANVVANMVTSGATVSTGLLSVPLILGAVGTAGYGVWTLARTVMVYAASAEIGLGPAIQRHIAVRPDGRDPERVCAVVWTSIVLYAVVGIAAMALGFLAAPVLVSAFGLPRELRSEAEHMLRLISLAMLVTLLAIALNNVLQGLERFRVLAVSTIAAAGVFLAFVAMARFNRWGLSGLGVAAIGQAVTMLLVRAGALRRVLLGCRPALLPRREIREMLHMSARLQVTALTSLVNTQTDKLVIGLIAGPTTLGEIGIAAQLAEAARMVGAASIPPMVTRFAGSMGAGAAAETRGVAVKAVRMASIGVIVLAVLAPLNVYPAITGWLGPGHAKAALFGTVLLVAYGCFLLCSPALAYLRASGRPQLEVRYGLLAMSVNIAATVGLGITVGTIGVVVATLLAYGGGAAWLLAKVSKVAPDARLQLAGIPRLLVLAVMMGAASGAWGLFMLRVLPPHVALVPILVADAVVTLGFVAASVRWQGLR